MRMGLLGVQSLNERLQALLNPSGTGFQVGERLYRVGDRVIDSVHSNRCDGERRALNNDREASRTALLVSLPDSKKGPKPPI